MYNQNFGYNGPGHMSRFASGAAPQRTVSLKERNERIGRLMQTQQGRHMLAQSLTQPLRLRRDYTAVGRKSLLVENLPDGANSYYDKDPSVTAFVVGEEGENIVAVVKSRRVQIPLYEIASNPEIPLSVIKEKRFDMIERAQDLGRSEIQAAEDTRFFAILDAVAQNGFDSQPGQQNPDIPVLAPINGAVLADAFASIERHDLRVSKLYMHATDYADFRKFGRDILSFEQQDVLLRTGLQSYLWGAQIITSRLVPPGFVYILTDPEMLGRMPVRTELTVLSADDPKRRMIGFSMFEQIGQGVYNPKGLVRLSVARG